MRSLTGTLLLVPLLVAGALVFHGSSTERPFGFDHGVVPAFALTMMEPGETLCQTPIGLPEAVHRVEFVIAPGGQVAGPVDVQLREGGPEGSVLAKGRVPRAQLTGHWTGTDLDRRVDSERIVALCLTNQGPDAFEAWGNFDSDVSAEDFRRYADRVLANPGLSTSAAVTADAEHLGDLAARYPAVEPRSVLSLVPDAFERAALFDVPFVGGWTAWALLGFAMLAPALLLRAIRDATAADDPDA